LHESLAQIYDRHADALYGFLLNLTRDEADTRDVLQEVFLKLARQPALLADVRDERGFLLRLAHNKARDLFRRRDARNRNEGRFADEACTVFEPGDPGDDAVFREQVAAALGLLPEEQRAVVHLKLWEGLTFDAIGAVLGIPLHTAASRYRYAIDKLRSHLRPILTKP